MDYFRVRDKNQAVAAAESQGVIADSMDGRMRIVNAIKSGEMTLEEGQKELAQIKRNASKNGQTTRGRVWRQS